MVRALVLASAPIRSRAFGGVGGAQLSTTAPFSRTSLPQIKNEPFLHYAPGSAERKALREALDQMKAASPCKIPVLIQREGGERVAARLRGACFRASERAAGAQIHTDDVQQQLQANEKLLKEARARARPEPAGERRRRFADAGRARTGAREGAAGEASSHHWATSPSSWGKNLWQAEIDAPVETIDFWRFSAKFAEQIYQQQPPENSPGVWNRMEYRPLEGFVAAVSPFNFTAIGANLTSSPAIMGNVCLWKPSSTATLSNWVIYQILREAGLPDGVIQFVPAPGPLFGDVCVSSPHLAGLHFTGSTATFMKLYKMVADNLENYKTFPRIVGETGGKNFHMVHRSADPAQVALHSLRSEFEYQGQKCSALSRLYCPDNLWPQVRERLRRVKMGPVEVVLPALLFANLLRAERETFSLLLRRLWGSGVLLLTGHGPRAVPEADARAAIAAEFRRRAAAAPSRAQLAQHALFKEWFEAEGRGEAAVQRPSRLRRAAEQRRLANRDPATRTPAHWLWRRFQAAGGGPGEPPGPPPTPTPSTTSLEDVQNFGNIFL
eukprot:tig00000430_g617.t1